MARLDAAGLNLGVLKESLPSKCPEGVPTVVGVWVVLGDFNTLLSFRDKNGHPSSVSEMLSFRNVISNLGLIDLPIINKSFTWTNERPSPILERLDRALISRDWHILFPRSILRAMPQPRSDHTPLVLSAFSFVPATHLFRFESFWLRCPDISEVTNYSWSSPNATVEPACRFSLKLSNVSGALKD